MELTRIVFLLMSSSCVMRGIKTFRAEEEWSFYAYFIRNGPKVRGIGPKERTLGICPQATTTVFLS